MMSLEFNKPKGLCLEGNISENFKIFKQEILIYFKATETDKKDTGLQVARLLNLLGHDGLKLYNKIKKEEPETVDTILKALEIYCIPKTNEIIEHFNFFNCKQGEGEQFDNWYTHLKKLIKECNFGDVEDKMLKTQIIMGIFNKETQKILLRDDVGLAKVVAYCQSIERAESNRRMLSSTKEVDKIVGFVGFKSKSGTDDMGKRNNSNPSQWKKNNANDRQMEITEDRDNQYTKLLNYMITMKHEMRSIHEKLDILIQTGKENSKTKMTRESGVFDTSIIDSRLPIENEEKLETLETDISNDKSFRNQLVLRLSSVGGKTIKCMVKRIMTLLFTPEILCKFSYTGRGNKKRPFEKLLVKNVIFESVKTIKKFSSSDNASNEIEQYIKYVLIQTPFKIKNKTSG